MELRQLEAFVAVAEERNFTRPAPCRPVRAVGHHPRPRERELRASLFSRTTRPVGLTAAGTVLLGDARRTLASAHAAAEAVAAVPGLRRGTLTLGILQAPSLFDLPGAARPLPPRSPGHPSRRLQTHSDTTGLGRAADWTRFSRRLLRKDQCTCPMTTQSIPAAEKAATATEASQ